MTVCGTALVVDHTWLIDPRDLLKTAADAGTVAATIEMNRQFLNDPDIGDADLQDALQQVAERYVILNLDHLTADRLEHAKETLEVQAQPDRATRSVDVNVSADLGGTLFAQYIPLFGGADMPGPIRTMSVVESTKVPVEVVLAIDVSTSMTRGVDGTPYVPYEDSRMKVVKDASLALMEALDPSPHHRIALGIVPWHFLVRLDKPARARWGGFQWVTYPNSRYYADPYRNWGGTIEPDGITQTLPSPPPQNWRGCLDEHRITGGAGHAETPATGDLSMPPPHLPFAQAFYPALEDHAYDCSPEPLPANYYLQFCYTQVVSNQTWKQRIHQPQHDCATSGAAMLPLSSNQVIIKDAIEALAAVGEGTYSSLGILWAHRMLLPEWKRIWGGGVHPLDSEADENQGLRKAIVLLTDGEDNYCGEDPGACLESDLGIDRSEACTLAKDGGHEVFVVAAMPPGDISSDLAQSLRDCSSEADYPAGTYVFINNEEDKDLRAAFLSIANQLQQVRRVL